MPVYSLSKTITFLSQIEKQSGPVRLIICCELIENISIGSNRGNQAPLFVGYGGLDSHHHSLSTTKYTAKGPNNEYINGNFFALESSRIKASI